MKEPLGWNAVSRQRNISINSLVVTAIMAFVTTSITTLVVVSSDLCFSPNCHHRSMPQFYRNAIANIDVRNDNRGCDSYGIYKAGNAGRWGGGDIMATSRDYDQGWR